MPSAPEKAPDAQRGQFLALLSKSLAADTFIKLVLAKYRGTEPELLRVIARRLTVRGEPCLSFTYRYKTRDVTKNVPVAEAVAAIGEELGTAFENAHLLTATQDIQLAVSRKGKHSLRVGRAEITDVPPEEHDRDKQRFLELDRPFLAALGVTDAQHRLIPAMARKWKQINKFIEVLDHAYASSGLKGAKQVRVVDFGSGKGYLTFAVHDYLANTLGLDARVAGVELRADLVQLCGAAAARLGAEGLTFEQGDIRSHAAGPIDIMIALHACDTATDYAIHAGIRSGASIVMCAPCCHKEIRPQMQTPPLLRPMLQHGIHLGQEAEMLTDGLRSLLLESEGYDSKIFEFVSLEHTSKNKMILAVKRLHPADPAPVRDQIRRIKDFYGIREQSLERLLQADAAAG
ncbi:MAG: SAM-dependent methyltransferase [Proteobacteria bacterium]|nr:SAM-dependent methyltransferase [Pseudomonadota bacterium]